MGSLCSSCFKGAEEGHLITPDSEIRRRQMAEAAEKRLQQSENRGIKNPDSVKRAQERQKEIEELEKQQAFSGESNMRWQAN